MLHFLWDGPYMELRPACRRSIALQQLFQSGSDRWLLCRHEPNDGRTLGTFEGPDLELIGKSIRYKGRLRVGIGESDPIIRLCRRGHWI